MTYRLTYKSQIPKISGYIYGEMTATPLQRCTAMLSRMFNHQDHSFSFGSLKAQTNSKCSTGSCSWIDSTLGIFRGEKTSRLKITISPAFCVILKGRRQHFTYFSIALSAKGVGST
jgi:hypothetical protein